MLLSYLKDHYGDLASVAGLVVTFVGFIATIRNVRKAKQAAEEARQAAREAVSRIGSQILANEIGTTLELVRQIDAACRARDLSGAIYRCDEARTRLAQVVENPQLEPSERELLDRALGNFGTTIPVLQKIKDSSDPGPTTIPPRFGKQLHDMIEDLGKIKTRLQNKTMEI